VSDCRGVGLFRVRLSSVRLSWHDSNACVLLPVGGTAAWKLQKKHKTKLNQSICIYAYIVHIDDEFRKL
jgi:hypothetical protein